MHNRTTSSFGDRPLGMETSPGLNNEQADAAALAGAITAAVKATAADHGSRISVVETFRALGHQDHTIYRHIAAACRKHNLHLRRTRRPAPRDGMTENEQAAHLAEVAPALKAATADVADIERLAKTTKPSDSSPLPGADTIEPPDQDIEPHASRALGPATPRGGQLTDRPVDLAQRIHKSLDTIDKLATMAEHHDGSIKNPRLAITTIDLLGKTAERLARIQADLSDQSRVADYLRGVEAAILDEEDPVVRARLAKRLRVHNANFGILT
jgi:hypothetical protein